MFAFIITALFSFVIYLLFTVGSSVEGSDFLGLGLWSIEELLFGIILSVIVGIIGRKIFVKKSFRMLNPVRWFIFLGYLIGPFFVSLAKANIDVAYRVITGKINPGIVKISPNLKTDLGVTMLANSITLTPGTLSVDIDENSNDLYIHWINVKNEALKKPPVDCKYICGSFDKWIRRIAE
jgi:multicomponent Na+:H+ antiporter subunit E